MLPFGQLKVTTWETDLSFCQEDQDGHYQHNHRMVITLVDNNMRSSPINQVGSGVRIGRRGEKLNLTESSSILKVVLFDFMSYGG